MRNIFIASMVAVVMISTAAPVSALTADEIQVQIKELLQRIADLTKQLNDLRAQMPPAPSVIGSVMPAKHRICYILERNLGVGAQGDDVRGLQEFLYENKFLPVSPTGYFGSLTADAVRRWQQGEGVAAVGAFGPLSRERIKIWCGGGGWINQERFSAAPVRGTAPLTVTFDTWLSGFRPNTLYYEIDFGDGTQGRAADCPAPADACTGPGQNTHTYTQDGTYTAVLYKVVDPCAGQVACRAAIQRESVAKTQIVVGAVACTKEYRPVCGAQPIVCIKAPCNPIPTTYSNRCMMDADGASYLYDGACRTDTSNRPPTISGLSGPTTLAIGVSGSWTVSASDPEGGSLSYQIWWGDESTYGSGVNASAAAPAFTQTTSFTHAYATAGTYTITIVVRDSAGMESKTSTTVKVGETPVACTMQYDPVCGRPAGCANTCAPGMYCTAICQLHQPQTYGNRCALDAVGATYLHSGECTASSGNWY